MILTFNLAKLIYIKEDKKKNLRFKFELLVHLY
jgi:hypothetical protein